MARGFESKDVEYQQAEAERRLSAARPLTAGERETLERRRTLQLSLARTEAELGAARSAAHRRMLEGAIAELRARLGRT